MIILMGVAGSGKSVQSRLLADEYGYAWISTGEILRVLITGKRRQEMLEGKLLNDTEMIQVIDKVLDLIDTKQEFVLDGFPRTVPQADWLLKQVEAGRFKLTAIFHLTANEKIVHERLIQRGRIDDAEDAIKTRFNEYKAVTLPIIEHFSQEGIHVYNIDAAQEPKAVHDSIMEVVHMNNSGNKLQGRFMLTRVKTDSEISSMRESGLMLATVLDILKKNTKEGMSTKDLAVMASKELNKLGGKPAFLGFQGFPDVLCTSINEEVVHGIPRTNKIIRSGDIVSLDFGVNYRNMITDAALSFIAGGKGSLECQKLVDATEQSMYAGIDSVHDAVRTGDIGNAVETVLNKQHYGVIRDLVGHGVGHYLHEDPNIPNYGHKGKGEILHTGMTIAIEPMATLGTHNIVIDDDGWTILTEDGSWAAHFEHTILITEDGAEILTRLP